MEAIFQTNFNDIKLFRRGKVRDVYEIDDKLIFVASDRISAFDVIMNEPIPTKGEILTKISKFWFEKTRHIIKNHFISTDINDFPEICKKYEKELKGRAMLVKKSKPIMLECVVRGYVAGSGWKEYKKQGTICGIKLPSGLKEYGKLPEPIFTPSTKAEVGHDENIGFDAAVKIVGEEIANKLRKYSLELYNFAYNYLYQRGIILADTKFEFGLDENNEIILIDEALTPDSSRFWLLENYNAGKVEMNFDKQVLRDYLETTSWNKQAPAPTLPDEIINKTIDKYKFALKAICGN
ncbi:MAG: phosphoribosylaminoimidazolesuccinocarboxamide synthase [Bacteroidetes bacterium]|nr:phosphoribosylaminoimidazolesuccinocarboxamide synthase [Bacteroidota bacterium]